MEQGYRTALNLGMEPGRSFRDTPVCGRDNIRWISVYKEDFRLFWLLTVRDQATVFYTRISDSTQTSTYTVFVLGSVALRVR